MTAINRELHKAFVWFNQDGFKTIRTGNWGAGAFSGDRRLKFIIQAIVCTYLKKDMVYICFDKTGKSTLTSVLQSCKGKTIKELYAKLSTVTSKVIFESLLK